MWYDLSCPLDVVGVTPIMAPEGPCCQIILCNLGSAHITDVEIILSLSDAEGQEVERRQQAFADVDGRPGISFAVSVPLEASENAASCTVAVDRIRFSDASTWRRGKTSMIEYESNALPAGRELDVLRKHAGADAVGYPLAQDKCWVCICGRPNDPAAPTCGRCRRSREEVFARFNPKSVSGREQMKQDQRDNRVAETIRDTSERNLQREAEECRRRGRKKRRLGLALGSAAAAVLIFAAVFWLVPYVRYRSAVSAMNSGGYRIAQERFLSMGDYRDALALAQQARFQANQTAVLNGSLAELQAAREDLLQMTGTDGAAALLEQADYRLAALLLQEGDYEQAHALLLPRAGGGQADALIRQADLARADALMASGAYDLAEAAYTALGESGKAAECIYLAGKKAMSFQDREGAIQDFSRIPDYQDAAQLTMQLWYETGMAQEEAGEGTEAGKSYLKAGEYRDAAERAGACLYPAAGEAMAAGRYDEAAALYALIPDYQDAAEQYRVCAYRQAGIHMKNREYAEAERLLLTLPDGYEETLQQRQEAIYQQALSALENRDYQAAAEGFGRISTYRDSAQRLTESRYWQGEALQQAGEWAGALKMLEQTSGYSDTAERLPLIRYERASELMEQGAFAEAAELFALAGDYQDAAERRKAALYARAEALQAGGSWAEASAVFASLNGYEDSASRVKACAYAQARQLEEQGSLSEAEAQYRRAGDWQDAPEKARTLSMTLAEQAEAGGQVLAAARLYARAGAEAEAERCYDAYYGENAAAAREALSRHEDELVLTLLGNMDLQELPEKYSGLLDCWREANYRMAMRFEEEGLVFDALPYWQAIPGYLEADTRLQRSCYRLLGTWSGKEGETCVFALDGTCLIDQERLYFNAAGNILSTGPAPDALRQTHTISDIQENALELKAGGRRISLTRSGEAPQTAPQAPASTASPAPSASPKAEDYLVTDDE